MRILAILFFLVSPLRAQSDPVRISRPGGAASGGPSVVITPPAGVVEAGPGTSFNGLKSAAHNATFGARPFRVLQPMGTGVEGNATLVEMKGARWVRKWWPATRPEPLARVQNELFFLQLIREFESETFDVVDHAYAQPDGNGGWYYFTEFKEGAAPDAARYETGLTQTQRVKLAALRFVWSLCDLHGSNVLFTDSGKPFLIDFEMAGDNGPGMSNQVFDRSALKAPSRAAVENLIYFKQQPFFMKQTEEFARMGPYAEEVKRWRERLSDPEVMGRVLRMLKTAKFSDEEIQAYLGNVRANLDNFERNFKPYLDEVNEIVKRRQKQHSSLKFLRRYFPALGDAVAAVGDSYLARSRNS